MLPFHAGIVSDHRAHSARQAGLFPSVASSLRRFVALLSAPTPSLIQLDTTLYISPPADPPLPCLKTSRNVSFFRGRLYETKPPPHPKTPVPTPPTRFSRFWTAQIKPNSKPRKPIRLSARARWYDEPIMDDFHGKRITVAGLGRFGGQIAAARWLAQQ